MCHVLIIEDEWLIAEHIAGLAEDCGATSVRIAATEEDAVEAARAEPPCIILSDVRLLEGTGPGAVAAIRRAQGAVPVIFITGTPEDVEPHEPPTVILGKPISNAAVLHNFRSLAPL